MTRQVVRFAWFAVLALGFGPIGVGRAADAPLVEPAELARRPELVGREVLVEDRIRYFLESKKGQGYDELILKRTEVPFFLPAKVRYRRPPSEPNAVIRAILKVVDGRLMGEVVTLELLPADNDRLDRELARTRPDDFATRRTWALWAERRGSELNDPKLAARGAVLEADALWVEASRPGADALALADGVANRPIPRASRLALYHRGFRAAAARATTPAEVDELTKRVAAALPRSTEPQLAATAPSESSDVDPASAYRAATDDARVGLDRRLYADLVEKSLNLRLAMDPAAAAGLAAEAARLLPDRPAVADRLRQRGLAEAERGVATMRQSQVEELAQTFRATGQDDRARRLVEEWLGERRKNRLSATDADGRILLAANYEKLLGDRATAGALLREAATIDPESRGVADAFLRLGFRKGDSGWYDPTAAQSRAESPPPSSANPTRSAETGDSLRGLTQAQARSKMGGKPDRVVRSATQGLIVEQWIYRIGRTDQFLIFRVDSATTEPRVSAAYSVSR